jgi:lipopolysaccharide transport system ATP-binding protein
MHPAIVAQAIGKKFSRQAADRPRTIMEAALAGFRRAPAEMFWALQEVSFTVAPGEMLGVIGANGAGKSTLLQVLSGIVNADRGQVQVNGRMGAMLDLGSGFHPDLTGRENVLIGAVVGGLTQREAQRRFAAIVEFAELEAFIDSPLRTYSTGMQMRLGFAVAIHTQPDVMLVDEYLSVGDLAFQAKCLDRILDLKRNGCAIVLISHNPEQVAKLADRALWLDRGQVKLLGDPTVVTGSYTGKTDFSLHLRQENTNDHSHQVELVDLTLGDGNQSSIPEIQSGDPLTLQITYQAHERLDNVIFGVSIGDQDHPNYVVTNTGTWGLAVPVQPGQGQVRLVLDRLDLPTGQYQINVGIFSPDWSVIHDYRWDLCRLHVGWLPDEQSLVYPSRRWEIIMPEGARPVAGQRRFS